MNHRHFRPPYENQRVGLGGPGVQPGLGQPPASQSFGHAPGTPVGLLLRGCSLLPRAPRPVAGPRHGHRRVPVPRTDTPRLCSLSRRAGSPRSRRPVGQRGDGGHRRPRSPASCPCPGCRGLRPAGPRSPLRADGARGGSWAAGPGLVTWPQGPGTESPQCLRAMSSSVCGCMPDPHALLGSRKSHPVTALPGARRGALCIVPNETRRPHRGAAELALPWVTHPRPAGPPEGIAFGETNGKMPPGFILWTRSSQ